MMVRPRCDGRSGSLLLLRLSSPKAGLSTGRSNTKRKVTGPLRADRLGRNTVASGLPPLGRMPQESRSRHPQMRVAME